MVTGQAAKRDVWVFLALLLLFSSIFYLLVFSTPDAPKQWGRYVLPFMWCPGLAALITKFVRDRTLRGLGWGWGRTRYFLIAYGLAIAGCLLPYLLVWVPFDAFSRGQFHEALVKVGLPPAFQGVLQIATLETSVTSYLTTEYGASFAVVGCLVARIFWRKRHEIQGASVPS